MDIAGALVSRRVHVPSGAGWARYLEIVSNPGTTAIEVDLRVLGYSVGAASLTSSGALPASIADRWAVAVGSATKLTLGFVFAGASTVQLTDDVQYFYPNPSYQYGWTVTLAPGESASFLHFVILGASADPAPAAQLAAQLSTLAAPGALDGLDAAARASIRNFTVG
jgi:hypothetical protein